MDIIKIELRELRPSDEMCLTNGEVVKPPNESIYLGINDIPDNWHEITEEEYNAIMKQQAELDAIKI